jgi:glycosyltransferase involved in cell wall biosynthesis
MNNIKYSILILCYNQQEYIQQSIESCLNQSVKPHEIIIADDFSTDKTRSIIQKYNDNFPIIIKPIFNGKNLGIYSNYNNAIQHLTGDIFIGLGGDDYLLPDAILNLDNTIKKESIDIYQNKVFVIANHYMRQPNNSYFLWNNFKSRNISAFKEQIRLGLAARDFGISVRTIKECLIPTDLGISADALRNLDLAYKTDIFLYTDAVTTVHRIGSGITAKTKMEEYCVSSLKFRDMINKDRYPILDKKDLLFIKMLKYRELMFSSKNYHYIYNYIIYTFYLFLNINNFSKSNSFRANLKYSLPFYNKISFFVKTLLYK